MIGSPPAVDDRHPLIAYAGLVVGDEPGQSLAQGAE
jgi:hypothetical protein